MRAIVVWVVLVVGCSSREPIVFVPWPETARYAWDRDELQARDVWAEAATRLGAATQIAQVRARVVGATFEARTMEREGSASPPPTIESGQIDENAGLIELNSASVAELDGLPRIGPALAQRIVDARPFRRVEDLRRVSGIGDATFAGLRERVFVAPREAD